MDAPILGAPVKGNRLASDVAHRFLNGLRIREQSQILSQVIEVVWVGLECVDLPTKLGEPPSEIPDMGSYVNCGTDRPIREISLDKVEF